MAFSSRHEGIAVYLARLLRPIWKLNVSKAEYVSYLPLQRSLTPKYSAKTPAQQVSNVPEATLVSVQLELSKLLAFMHKFASQPLSSKAR